MTEKTASEKYGVAVVEESFTSLRSGKKSISVVALEGVADVPPAAYHKGVDIGLVEYETDAGELASGTYTLRLTAREEIRERGDHVAIAEFVDAEGSVASRRRIDIDVFSVDIPERRDFDSSVFSLESRFREDMPGRFNPFVIVIGWWCSNGSHAVFVLG